MLRGPRPHDDFPDREIGDALRAFGAAPDDTYWPALERRIVARVVDERTPWWMVLASWTRPAAVAAAVVMLVAALILGTSFMNEQATAYAAVGDEQISAFDSAAFANSTDPAVAVQVVFEP